MPNNLIAGTTVDDRDTFIMRELSSMLDVFKWGNDFEGKDTFGNLIFVPCPPKSAIEWDLI